MAKFLSISWFRPPHDTTYQTDQNKLRRPTRLFCGRRTDVARIDPRRSYCVIYDRFSVVKRLKSVARSTGDHDVSEIQSHSVIRRPTRYVRCIVYIVTHQPANFNRPSKQASLFAQLINKDNIDNNIQGQPARKAHEAQHCWPPCKKNSTKCAWHLHCSVGLCHATVNIYTVFSHVSVTYMYNRLVTSSCSLQCLSYRSRESVLYYVVSKQD